MARSVATIQALIVTNFQAQPELAAANSTSKRAIWYLLTFIVATAINVFEQLLDLFKANITAIVALSAPATPQWLQAKIFNFQYSATNPQNIQLINTVPTYAVCPFQSIIPPSEVGPPQTAGRVAFSSREAASGASSTVIRRMHKSCFSSAFAQVIISHGPRCCQARPGP